MSFKSGLRWGPFINFSLKEKKSLWAFVVGNGYCRSNNSNNEGSYNNAGDNDNIDNNDDNLPSSLEASFVQAAFNVAAV